MFLKTTLERLFALFESFYCTYSCLSFCSENFYKANDSKSIKLLFTIYSWDMKVWAHFIQVGDCRLIRRKKENATSLSISIPSHILKIHYFYHKIKFRRDIHYRINYYIQINASFNVKFVIICILQINLFFLN